MKRRTLPEARVMTGRERHWIHPNRGLIKVIDRQLDRLVSRFLFPHLAPIWDPYTWLITRRFEVADATIAPPGWPSNLDRLRVLLLSDIHAGIFLSPLTLSTIVGELMRLEPDLVAITGDIVTGHSREVRGVTEALAPLARAPLGAWYCHGNHDYFGGNPREIRDDLQAVSIRTLANDSVRLSHGHGEFILGGIDDLLLGKPDWTRVLAKHGPPHVLLAHNPDHFYEAESRGVAITLSGHTHGGQIRFANGGPIIRQSRFCLDEGLFAFRASRLVVSRGLGSILLPWRWGANPEAVLIEVIPATR